MTTSHKPLVYIISAPSGSGKSTLVTKLLQLVPDLDFSISYTTRLPRGSEENGKQYFFVSRDEFERMIYADEFLEYAEVFGNYYGTGWNVLREAERKGRDVLLDIDVQGAKQIKHRLTEAVSIFVLPPDRKTLEWRLRHRGEDKEEVIQRRLVTASREIENYDKYNYILINDDLRESIESLEAIVRAERLSRWGRPLTDEEKITVALADRCRLANIRDRVQRILDSFFPPEGAAG
ncbi:MAG TPA: guanylate kinase [Candidatus Sulfotelmatobacter sp.]|nr:guanylate kinase [Candidatus Sulfotelmatobacter sp.]